jgi:two-component system phosphate regulon sensor histidine kinase PhoR
MLAAALAAGAGWLALAPGLANETPVVRVALGSIAAGLAALVVLFPVALVVDRTLRMLAQRLADSADTSPITGPWWLGPLLAPFCRAHDDLVEATGRLETDLRDLQVRHQVARHENQRLAAALNSLRDGVIVTNGFNEISVANDAAAAILGFSIPDALHHPADEVIHDTRLATLLRDTLDHANTTERRHVEYELSLPDHDAPIAFDICVTGVASESGEAGGVMMILRDISRDREISQMKSDFVSKASHELRTPLSSIRAYVEMLVDGEARDESARREFYEVIQHETERLGRLIDNMLNISRIEAGIVQIEREPVDLREICRRASDTIGPQAAEKNIIILDRCAEVDLTVEGESDMLFQVILNLLSNAVKYTPEGGRVTLAADSDNLTRSVVVTVSDTGLGIPPDALPRLFDKFYRVESFKRVAKGTGLGLNLCKHIVETVHHGSIGVESSLGMGSKFWFSVPMRYAGSSVAA